MKLKITLTLLFTSISFFAQKNDYLVDKIPDSLKQNANAVVRLYTTDVSIQSQRNMNIKTKRVVTVFNEKGLEAVEAFEHYSKNTNIHNIEALVYNAFGMEIKKIKRKDFRDQSAVDGGTMFSDNRVIYLNYTPTEYPFTIVYIAEVETSNTAFIPSWIPLNDYSVSLEKSVLNVNFPNNLGFKKKETNFETYKILKTSDTELNLSYTISNIVAQKQEDNSQIGKVFPKLMIGLELFNLEGVDGNAKTWIDFGKWYSDKILTGTIELPEETKTKIKSLVGQENDPIKKAKIIYNYVQQKSRYVSIQVGIGGWKPMLAKDVDRLGYGDCKALSNYTKALLEVVNVPSYNTILYGDRNQINIENDFVSMQGNHMILAIPSGDNYVWLECTSQEDPFGYQGIFTDDREVLVIKPEGGEIVRTKIYSENDNSQISKGNYTISDNGDFSGTVSIISKGSQYSRKFDLEKKSSEEKEAYYKEYWNNINNLKIKKSIFLNDKENVIFTENIDISAVNYANISSNILMFVPNALNKYGGAIKKIRNRKQSFEIQRGYYDNDEIKIMLPSDFKIESIPNNFELKTKFGTYKTEIIKEENNLVYKRTLLVQKGIYTNKEYEEYRLFMEQINKNDNAKIVLNKNS